MLLDPWLSLFLALNWQLLQPKRQAKSLPAGSTPSAHVHLDLWDDKEERQLLVEAADHELQRQDDRIQDLEFQKIWDLTSGFKATLLAVYRGTMG